MKYSGVFLVMVFLFFPFLNTGCRTNIVGKAAAHTSENTELTGTGKTVRIRISCWNLQNFFDSETVGTEYDEYKDSSSNWTRSAYLSRIKRLCETIQSLDPDVFVMEEIENAAELYDISNVLASDSWDMKKIYRYACFASGPGSALGCAVISRIPLVSMKVHSLEMKGAFNQPSMRPVIQVVLLKDSRQLTLFVNHWKSKSGGAESTEDWRSWQESLLAGLIEESSSNSNGVVACGDFNRDITEFTTIAAGEGSLILLAADPGFPYDRNVSNVLLYYVPFPVPCYESSRTTEDVSECPVYSPWLLEDGNIMQGGSYYYKNEWERIDSFFIAGNAILADFAIEDNGFWADEDGIPKRYELWSGSGYSDHLPISCTVEF